MNCLLIFLCCLLNAHSAKAAPAATTSDKKLTKLKNRSHLISLLSQIDQTLFQKLKKSTTSIQENLDPILKVIPEPQQKALIAAFSTWENTTNTTNTTNLEEQAEANTTLKKSIFSVLNLDPKPHQKPNIPLGQKQLTSCSHCHATASISSKYFSPIMVYNLLHDFSKGEKHYFADQLSEHEIWSLSYALLQIPPEASPQTRLSSKISLSTH
jgi:hypothetical protein